MRRAPRSWSVFLLLAACAKAPPPVAAPEATPAAPAAPEAGGERVQSEVVGVVLLPASLQGRVEVLPAEDPAAAAAALSKAVKEAGMGGVYEGWAVRTTEDLTVWRMWNGPDVVDEAGRTNRLGGWWTAEQPAGPVDQYRLDYEICDSWNDLTWVASCTLRAGAVVAVGPGQSVSLETCGDDTPPLEEGSALAFGQSPEHWQVYIHQPWNRTEELDCTVDTADYRADPEELSRALE